MIGGLHEVDLIVSVAGLMLSILGLVMSLISRYLDKNTRRFFTAFFGVIIAYVSAILIRTLIGSYDGYTMAVISRIVFFAQAFISSVLTVILCGFLLYQSGDGKWWRQAGFCLSVGLWAVCAILLVINLFCGFIYVVDDNNRYMRGEFFPVIMIAPILIMFVNIFLLIKNHKNLSKKQIYAFAIYILLPMIAMIIQGLFYFGIHLIVIATVVAALFLFAYIVSDQAERYCAWEAQNAQLKNDILLAQIHPHFISNTLITIRHLYKENPAKAEKAMKDFSDYLRHNMDSLTTDSPIPFEVELDHVREYVGLQLLRFEDDLKVEYDIEYMDFLIPTLTLQPLVENAISYGVRKSESGSGTVLIRSVKKEDHIEVSVTDDGAGFTVDETDGDQSHNGINNVRERLRTLSDGDLVIRSERGVGTVATIRLPI